MSLKEALKKDHLTLIAEFKRRSPSAGELLDVEDPLPQVSKYIAAGASALSILTEKSRFGGSLEDLRKVADANPGIPILRKDFISEMFQLEESKRAGATAVLLIVSVLGERTKEFLKEAKRLGLDALVEVHDERELAIALNADAEIIGVNNRNLATLKVDLQVSLRLAPLMPSHVIKVAESGIKTFEDVQKMKEAGYDALLIGHTLMKAEDPQKMIQELMR